jgi:sirohydrochlorin cobaltochelatase
MAISSEDQAGLKSLELRIGAILPEQYQDSYFEVQPLPMGSAGLKYGRDGGVAWDEMWGSFCDLAMAGGPPHKGKLLEPASQADIYADGDSYRQVVEEICRGIEMVADLSAEPASTPGWVGVQCVNRVTAEWLLRAITMENVSVRCQGTILELPAGPGYKIEKEIKNVITVMAKTSHYWFGHTSQDQRTTIRNLFAAMEQTSPLLQPAPSGYVFQPQAVKGRMPGMVHNLTGFPASSHAYPGWLGIEYPDIQSAIWLMRGLVASNVLSRREGTVLSCRSIHFATPTAKLPFDSWCG